MEAHQSSDISDAEMHMQVYARLRTDRRSISYGGIAIHIREDATQLALLSKSNTLCGMFMVYLK